MWPGTFRWSGIRVNCGLCGRDDCEVLFQQDQHAFRLRTVMCRQCGLVYLNPRPTAQEYDDFYQRWYHRLYPARAAFNAGKLGARIAAETARQRCHAYAGYLEGPVQLLEIGPGEGAFLSALQTMFPKSKTRGVDLSPMEVEVCRGKELEVVCGSIENLPKTFNDNTHIAVFHVLEHSLDPLNMLRQIAVRLRPGCYLFVEVPNILGSWQGLGMLHIAHPYQFAPATLGRTLHTAGFELICLEALEEPLFQSSIRAVARLSHEKVEPAPLPPMPTVDEMRLLFQRKLKNWRKELIVGGIKRYATACLGPHWSAALWEHTTGRQWARWLTQVALQV